MSDPAPSRRHLLSFAAVGVAGLHAGCGGLPSPFESPPKLGRIQVENRDDVPHTVHLIVERDEEIVYWRAFDLDAVSENDEGQLVRDIKQVPRSAWGDLAGDYRVLARLDDADFGAGGPRVATDAVNHGPPCELLNVIVHGEPTEASVSIINAPADEDCE